MSLTQFSDSYILDSFESSYYELLEKIGEGGFGKVFKAKQKSTGQMVAIKFLAIEPHCEEQKKQRYIERFKRETSLSSQLQHPNIVRLLDQGQVNDNLLFGVFEYVEGRSLREHLLLEGPFSAPEATDIMSQVLDALIHAHSKGIVHRDIKPANIMLSKTGAKLHAKILDFGIGTLTHDSRQADFRTLTLTQETLGTPSYSAPEQLRGEPATTKTDLYVWGLVYLECLTGSPAMNGTSVASIYHKQLSDAHIPLPSALLGHPLSGLLRRVLNKNAIERVITGEEAFSELKAINVSNLVGKIAQSFPVDTADDETIMMRNDHDTAAAPLGYTALTERKQITVLALRFSTSFTDPREHDLEVIDTLFKSQRNYCLDIATRFGAFHVGSVADISLFYYGHPTASDNDTRLCARSALEITSEISKRNALMKDAHGAQLNVHIGLHTGMFVTYANSTPEGHVANAAMTLARTAREKQILCSGETRAILDPYSEFEGYVELKLGQSYRPEPVFELKGERQVEAFGFMRGTRSNHEMVGRDKELSAAVSILNENNTNKKAVHIYGEAGIGKSRLLQEIRLNAAKYQHLVAQCLPEHKNNALYPILTLVKYIYDTNHLEARTAKELFAKLISEQDRNIEIENALSVLFIWLNIDLDKSIKAPLLSPDRQKELLFRSLTALFMSQHNSISQNKLYIIEDIHWADNTTIEFIKHFSNHLTPQQVIFSTSRNKLPVDLIETYHSDIHLKKLSGASTAVFIQKLFNDVPVSNNVIEVLINRTDGIPLFIEELIGMLKQKQLITVKSDEVNFESADALDQIPTTLRDSLQQKLDSLAHSKDTAQLAATIGREFEYGLLTKISSLSENQIQNDLNELIRNELIVQQRRVDSNTYIFKHALVRDAAYESMPHNVKIQYHEKIANSCLLEKEKYTFPVISHHFYQSNNIEPAIKYGVEHLNELLQLKTYHQAESYIDVLLSYNKEKGNERLEIEIYNVAFKALFCINGFISDKIDALMKRVFEIQQDYPEILDAAHLKIASWIKWVKFQGLHISGKRKEARTYGIEIIEGFKKENNLAMEAAVYCHLGQVYMVDGDLEESLELYQRAIDIEEEIGRDILLNDIGIDNTPVAFTLCALSHLHLNQIDQAKATAQKSIEKACESMNPISLAVTHVFSSLIYSMLREHEQVIEIGHSYYQNYHNEEHPIYFKKYMDIVYFTATNNTDKAIEAAQELLASDYGFATAWYIPYLVEKLHLNDETLANDLIDKCIQRTESESEVSGLPYVYLAKSKISSDLESKNFYRQKAEQLAISQSALFFLQ
ncbi:TOMM system kinase/cyclase fusion protein [Pseudoalteromonas luteoviolacea]|uniref:Protein kinase domain-containing protein n=1 Tax=Pseudoalteromonas luteoviolacea H33 TaxID=1365251 RepID=A0A167GVJ1_9GAMM|nr:TOMM system kinase/cyclase fusion protein [Pseudoalteromonas luteoviolacea]KZN56599.1 hypothetical protein N476_00560 [Pseudoalteromonas luteoviolacea H33]KZN75574.1 hypothetical protein N477_17955 [Pseudoalteromonas luteoviolacea H33-S]MBQ4876476.1 TOMM system kinase/cyclase fusion protein [Pseudoalteromonas luteoviolacea]MBQ4905107.1 TOMM system kinase/cyclase fusion protein [Pseudoalteromonas luteoviolacea]